MNLRLKKNNKKQSNTIKMKKNKYKRIKNKYEPKILKK